MKAFIKAAADERMQRSVSLCLFQGGAFEDLLDWLLLRAGLTAGHTFRRDSRGLVLVG